MRSICILFMSCLLLACNRQTAAPLPTPLQHSPESDGRWMLINYWAIWCHPCRAEIPELNEFAAEYAGDAIVYGVNYDAVDNDTLLTQAEDLGIVFPLLIDDPARDLDYARPMVLPTTMVISPDVEVWARLIGPQTVDSLAAAIQSEQQQLGPSIH